MTQRLLDQVAPLLRRASQELIVPRWRQLQADDAQQKSPGEWVTVVDQQVEAQLTAALQALLAGSTVVGQAAWDRARAYFPA